MDHKRPRTYPVLLVLFLTGAILILATGSTVAISPGIPFYSPMLSSTVGIGLVPTYSGISSGPIRYQWCTDYGTFLSWGPPGFEVIDRGPVATITDEPVYWSYLPAPGKISPAQVTIAVSVEDTRTGKVSATGRLVLEKEGAGFRVTAPRGGPWWERFPMQGCAMVPLLCKERNALHDG